MMMRAFGFAHVAPNPVRFALNPEGFPLCAPALPRSCELPAPNFEQLARDLPAIVLPCDPVAPSREGFVPSLEQSAPRAESPLPHSGPGPRLAQELGILEPRGPPGKAWYTPRRV